METELTDANFDEFIKNNPHAMVDFWAAWCGPCRMLAPTISEIADEHKEIAVGKLNVDDNPLTATKFKIMSIPAILFFKDGKLVDTVIGAVPKQVIEDSIEKLI